MILPHSILCCSEWRRVAFAASAIAGFGMEAEAAVPVYRPADPSEVVLRLDRTAGEQRLAKLQVASRNAPGDSGALTAYIDALVEAGAHSGNERYYGYAEQALREARLPMTSDLVLHKARLLQHRHEFQGAERLLGEVLSRDPRDREARLMRAQIRLHLHQPKLAAQDCAVLARLVDMLTTATCVAQARAASGDLKRAYALVSTALDSQQAEPATRSWSAGVAAEFSVRLGDTQAADRWYEEAFRLNPKDHYVRITYADWLLSSGRRDEAARISRAGASLADRTRLVLASQDAGSADSRKLQLAWQEAADRGDRTYLREQARFELELRRNAARAHALALQNFRDRTEPEDALLLATTSARTGDKVAMAQIAAWRERFAYEDVRLDRLLRALP